MEMNKVTYFAFGVLAVFTNLSIAAQSCPLTFQPPNPNSSQRIVITASANCVGSSIAAQQNGNTIRFNLTTPSGGLCLSAPFPITTTIGPLAPGTYTYEAYFDSESLCSSGSFVVTGVPGGATLSPGMLIALIIVLVAAGWKAVGRVW